MTLSPIGLCAYQVFGNTKKRIELGEFKAHKKAGPQFAYRK